MKQSTTTLNMALKNLITKIFFCSQVIVISFSLPSLFYVGISYNSESTPKKHLLITNKGKKTFVSAEKAERTFKYSPAFMRI